MAALTCIVLGCYAFWARNQRALPPLKLPKFVDRIDPHNAKPSGGVGQISNSRCSGFRYIDGKADTDLWASMCSLAGRFARHEGLLVRN